MNITEIRELIGLFSEHGLAKLELTRGDTRLALEAAAPAAGTKVAAPEAERESAPAAPGPAESGFVETSPAVGTVYLSAAPGEPPLVRVGDVVSAGQTLCVLETMKMFSDLTAHAAGVVVEICVKNGQAVGVGQALFKIAAEGRAV